MTKKTTNRQTLRLFWQTSKSYRLERNLAFAVAISSFVIGMFVLPLIMASFLDLVQTGQTGSDKIWQLLIAYAAAQIWSEVVGWRLVMYFAWRFETAIQRDVYTKIFDKLTNQTMFFHSNRFGGSLVSQSNKLTGAIERFWDVILFSILPVVISIVGSVIVLSFIFWQYAIFLLVFSILFGIFVHVNSRRMIILNEKEAKASNKVSGHLSDAVSNILAVKSSGMERHELNNFTKTANDWRQASLNLLKYFIGTSTINSSISAIVKIGALAFAVYASQRNMISIASIYLIVTYTQSVAQNLWNMNTIMRAYNRIMGDSREMVNILQGDISLIDKSDKKILVDKGSVQVKNITYTHDEGAGETLFSNFSLDIKPGEKIGLVGSSGSGKTTLTKLLLRFSDVDSGEILVDKQNIAEYTQESLRKQIAYVPQEPILFHRSIEENIAYAKPGATHKEVANAAKKAGAYDFITKLENGFETMVGERGVKLSGGQRQRIAIARAILKDSPILLLDEATSALDSESEKLIQKSFDTLMRNRTSIVIAHRLSTISKLDRIVVMDNGKIAESGTHDELLSKKGVYAKLWQHQSGGFIDE